MPGGAENDPRSAEAPTNPSPKGGGTETDTPSVALGPALTTETTRETVPPTCTRAVLVATDTERSAADGPTGPARGTGPASATLREGASPTDVSVPYPRRPSPPKPQQRTVASSSSAQVCEMPTVIARALRPPSGTGPALAGVSPASSPMLSWSPYPRRPLPPRPQQRTSPVSRMAQVWPR